MMKNYPKTMVIDASIANAASEKLQQISKNCSNFLIVFRKNKYKMALSKKISKEWRDHQTEFSLKWQTTMRQKGLVLPIDNDEDFALQDAIVEYAESIDIRKIMIKDLHLIVVAMKTDKTIFALDDKARFHFMKISNFIQSFKNIIWVNPNKQDEDVIKWLNNGAKIENERMLENYKK